MSVSISNSSKDLQYKPTIVFEVEEVEDYVDLYFKEIEQSSYNPDVKKFLTDSLFIHSIILGCEEWSLKPSVTIAQVILETGWGKCSLAKEHNYSGIKHRRGNA